jgi:hypothetical protein
MIASTSSLRLVDEIVGLHRLLSDGVDGVPRGSRALGVPYTGRLERLADLLEANDGSALGFAGPIDSRWGQLLGDSARVV